MAAPTIKSGQYGLNATGGVDETVITSDRVRLRGIIVNSGSAAGGSVVVKDKDGVVFGTFASATASRATSYPLDMIVDGLKITLSATDVYATFVY